MKEVQWTLSRLFILENELRIRQEANKNKFKEISNNQWWKWNNCLTGTIQYLSIPFQNFSHKYKKAIKSTSTFGPPCIVHFKNTKNVRYILKTTVSKSTKKRLAIGYVRLLALSPKVVQAMQLELFKFNTSHYSLLVNTVFAIYIP